MNERGIGEVLVEEAINRVLSMDPETAQGVADLGDRVLAIEVKGTGLSYFVSPVGDGVRVSRESASPADVTVAGAPLALMRLISGGAGDDLSLGGQVAITGDVAFAQQVKVLAQRLDLDWEEELSRVVGDTVAHQLGNAARQFWSWRAQAVETLYQDLAEYAREETNLVVTRDELEIFYTQVTDTRDAVERLEQRIQRLQSGEVARS
ncbi:MAG: sterol-binding protein [Gammaproteobacteria bacterium]|nr:MAG: sterol-binding protein [Gammaproteobacteria bacterium]